MDTKNLNVVLQMELQQDDEGLFFLVCGNPLDPDVVIPILTEEQAEAERITDLYATGMRQFFLHSIEGAHEITGLSSKLTDGSSPRRFH